MQSWKDELGQRFAAFVSAYESRDLDALRELFWHDDDVVLLGTQANLRFIGWAQVEHSFRKQCEGLRDIRLTLRSEPLWHGGAPPSTVACVSIPAFDISMTVGDTPSFHTEVRMSCVFERRGTAWRMVQMHWSLPREEVLLHHG